MSVLDQQLSRKYKLNFPRLLRSEWIKFFSLRSTWWLSIVAVVCNIGIVAGLAALVRYIEGQANLPAGADVETAVGFSSLSALVVQGCGLVGQLVFVILAILA
ncbi:MAG: hypothetical protein LBI33_02765, partial [Propionibacteriaceae bacterium]|nr:hypothetical protein [Propionibacteriaceae bacterium]